jgi:hypothetical protein
VALLIRCHVAQLVTGIADHRLVNAAGLGGLEHILELAASCKRARRKPVAVKPKLSNAD